MTLRTVFALSLAAALLAPAAALCCTGPAAQFVAIAYDGNKYTVSNIGKQRVHVVFTAFMGQTYVLDLYPGQSATPATKGWLNVPMKGYQSCTAS